MDRVAVLAHAKLLPPITVKELGRVAKRLAGSHAFVAVRHEASSGQLAFFRVPEHIVMAESREESTGRRKREARSTTHKEPVYRESKDRLRWQGFTRVSKGGSWSATLELPLDEGNAALLTIERKGKGGKLRPKDAALVIPEGEANTLLTLLSGLFARACRGPQLFGSPRKKAGHE
jgi:hypothetical protein